MLSIAICEDEPLMLAELNEKTNSFFVGHVIPYSVSHFTSGEQLLLAKSDYDILLLDIRLTGMSGMETAKVLRGRGKESAIIFITSSREDVFQAFDVDAVHFLVKPVDDKMLFSALDKAVHRIEKESKCWLTISNGNSVRNIPFGHIVYCESVNHQVTFCLQNGEKVVYYHKMADLHDKLDERFYHCHRSYVINLAHVASLENGAARMSNGDLVLVSRRSGKDLSQHLLAFLRREMME